MSNAPRSIDFFSSIRKCVGSFMQWPNNTNRSKRSLSKKIKIQNYSIIAWKYKWNWFSLRKKSMKLKIKIIIKSLFRFDELLHEKKVSSDDIRAQLLKWHWFAHNPHQNTYTQNADNDERKFRNTCTVEECLNHIRKMS